MRIVGYTCLHYGADWLDLAIRSALPQLDDLWILYTPQGSHGARINMPCPDSRDTLRAIVDRIASPKIHWHEGVYANEAEHRNTIYRLAPQADILFILDADEIWQPDHLSDLLNIAKIGDARNYLVRGIHFWRSVWRATVTDYSSPVRAINVRSTDMNDYQMSYDCYFAHMGYAQRSEIVHYKQYVHGHIGQWRKGWYDEKFATNAQEDVHPCNPNFWNVQAVDALKYLPPMVKNHPYYNLGLIP